MAVSVGTRPEIIKMAPVIWEILKRSDLELIFIHTCQHFSSYMSDTFIHDLNLPKPDFFLNVRSGSHAQQTARIMVRAERVLKNAVPDVVLVEGDTNSALGVALAASKLKIPIGHVEAGCRSFDRNMPEEINRILITDVATLHFAPTQFCKENLIREGINEQDIFLTGHPIVDLLMNVEKKINDSPIFKNLGIEKKAYYLLTIHRTENVDEPKKLQNILCAVAEVAKEISIIFPIHPHTRKNIRKFGMKKLLRNIISIPPLNYFDFINLVKHARLVLTDSGGVQQEAAILHTPCITLRETTEWIETVYGGVNFLAGTEANSILRTLHSVEANYDNIISKFDETKDIFGPPGASRKIVEQIMKRFSQHPVNNT
ncbi:MAG: UDP-N-acetylglucosamine 2-epimerase (non-hydrolyzing) [Candidatus Verstraetearchaeota archaeon]|nr:UDP-N-acetylglucosamine 2-epimerase (non-hydrolyzing) [Candidatus Verstraetearchaeota archaeon]